MKKKLFFTAVVLSVLFGAHSTEPHIQAFVAQEHTAGQQNTAENPASSVPECNLVTGTAAVTFTTDNGKTLTPTEERLSGIGYTFGLTALRQPDTLLAVHNATLIRSTDAGCSWAKIADLNDEGDYFPLKLEASVGDRAYGWGDNRRYLVRIDGTDVTYLKSPVDSIVGIGVDATNGDHLRAGGETGIWDSTDAGATWTRIGSLPVPNVSLILYRVAFDPTNLDHILVGTAQTGAFFTTNGGQTWKSSKGLGAGKDAKINAFEFAFSPVRGKVVWAMGLNLAESDAGQPSDGRHIYYSKNGGKSFKPVIDRDAEVTIRNQPVMKAHPTDPDVLYFVFGTYFQGYGTDLFRFDVKSKKLDKTHSDYNDIDSIEFSRTDPSTMYLGLEVEQVQ